MRNPAHSAVISAFDRSVTSAMAMVTMHKWSQHDRHAIVLVSIAPDVVFEAD